MAMLFSDNDSTYDPMQSLTSLGKGKGDRDVEAP